MAIMDVIKPELNNKCMPNGINMVGVHVDIYVCLCDMNAYLIRV